MDQRSPFTLDVDEVEQPRPGVLKRSITSALVLAALAGAAAGGYLVGQSGWRFPDWVPPELTTLLRGKPAPKASGPVVYYRDPDGKPAYSAEPAKTADGRDYVPVRASEDVTFEDAVPQAVREDASQGTLPSDDRKVLYYRNPMGLPDTSPTPKKDSMGMDYIPVYEGEDEDASSVKITPGKLQRTGVRSEPVARQAISRPVRAPGTVQLDERRIAVVALRSEGFIEKVENVTTGDRVRAGQPLMRLYSPDVAAAAAQYLSVVAGPTGSSPLLAEGARRRLENLNVPADALAEIERTRRVPRTITWSAPREGVVLERSAVDGMRASPGEVLFRIGDISTVWVLADVPEHVIGAVRPGQAVSIRAHALPGRSFRGNIGLIYPQVNRETRTTRVRVEIPNADGALLPDMYAEVEIATGSPAPVLAVPDSAIIDSGVRQLVILDKGEGRFEPREIKVGARGQGFVEVREGLGEGDQVVVSANFLIDAESNLKAALRSMTPAENQQ